MSIETLAYLIVIIVMVIYGLAGVAGWLHELIDDWKYDRRRKICQACDIYNDFTADRAYCHDCKKVA